MERKFVGKILPIAEPLITGYKHHALPLSILAGIPETRLSVLSYYIQLYTIYDVLSDPDCDWHWLDYCLHQYLTEMNPNPFFEVEIWDAREIGDYARFIETSIENKKYIYLFYDSYYLKNNSSYHKTHGPNNMLIYGYNGSQYYVYDYDYVRSMKLKEMRFHKDEIVQSVANLHVSADWFYRIALLKPKPVPDTRERDVLDRIEQFLHDYLHSRNTFLRFEALKEQGHFVLPVQERAKFGLDIYEVLIEYGAGVAASTQRPNKLPYSILWEHKRVLKALMICLEEIGWERKPWLHDMIDEIIKDAEVVRNVILKAFMLKTYEKCRDVSGILKSIAEKEKQFVSLFIESLRSGFVCPAPVGKKG